MLHLFFFCCHRRQQVYVLLQDTGPAWSAVHSLSLSSLERLIGNLNSSLEIKSHICYCRINILWDQLCVLQQKQTNPLKTTTAVVWGGEVIFIHNISIHHKIPQPAQIQNIQSIHFTDRLKLAFLKFGVIDLLVYIKSCLWTVK